MSFKDNQKKYTYYTLKYLNDADRFISFDFEPRDINIIIIKKKNIYNLLNPFRFE